MGHAGRERIVPPFPPRGLWPAMTLAGVCNGCALAVCIDNLAEWLAVNWPVAGPIVLAHVVALPLVLLGFVLGRQPLRVRHVAMAAAAFVPGIMLAAMAASLTGSLGFGVDVSLLSFPVQMLTIAFAYWFLGSLLMLLGWWLSRRLFGVPVAQTDPPRYCWVCAYERGAIDPCPECGTGAGSASAWLQGEAAAWRSVRRAALPALVALAVGFCAYAAWRVQADTLPTLRFVRAFGAERGWTPAYAYIDHLYPPSPQGLRGRYLNSMGFTRELGDGSGRMILVSYRALVPGGLPVMQVRLCAEATLPPGWPAGAQRMTDWGAPGTIVADLNREQAERVVRHGVPPSLIDAMIAKADEVGWKPWGGMQSGGTRIEIDPAPHFAGASSAGPE